MRFAQNSGRGTIRRSLDSAQVGDVIALADREGSQFHHLMGVTSGSGDSAAMSYHSTDTLERPLRDIRSDYPSAALRLIKMR